MRLNLVETKESEKRSVGIVGLTLAEQHRSSVLNMSLSCSCIGKADSGNAREFCITPKTRK